MASSPTYEPIEGANALGLGYNPFEQKLLEFKPRLFALDYEGDADHRWFTPEQAGYAELESADGATRKVSVPRCVLFDPTGERGDFQSELFESRSQVENSFVAGAQIRGGLRSLQCGL